MEDGDGSIAGEDEEGSTPDVWGFGPPHLTPPRQDHQGSSMMASRSDAEAAASSRGVGGIRV
jgi:hypothetical protein